MGRGVGTLQRSQSVRIVDMDHYGFLKYRIDFAENLYKIGLSYEITIGCYYEDLYFRPFCKVCIAFRVSKTQS